MKTVKELLEIKKNLEKDRLLFKNCVNFVSKILRDDDKTYFDFSRYSYNQDDVYFYFTEFVNAVICHVFNTDKFFSFTDVKYKKIYDTDYCKNFNYKIFMSGLNDPSFINDINVFKWGKLLENFIYNAYRNNTSGLQTALFCACKSLYGYGVSIISVEVLNNYSYRFKVYNPCNVFLNKNLDNDYDVIIFEEFWTKLKLDKYSKNINIKKIPENGTQVLTFYIKNGAFFSKYLIAKIEDDYLLIYFEENSNISFMINTNVFGFHDDLSAYGKSMLLPVLGSLIELDLLNDDLIEVKKLIVEPPIFVSSSNANKISLCAGAINYLDDMNVISVHNNVNYSDILKVLNSTKIEKNKLISKLFLSDKIYHPSYRKGSVETNYLSEQKNITFNNIVVVYHSVIIEVLNKLIPFLIKNNYFQGIPLDLFGSFDVAFFLEFGSNNFVLNSIIGYYNTIRTLGFDPTMLASEMDLKKINDVFLKHFGLLDYCNTQKSENNL